MAPKSMRPTSDPRHWLDGYCAGGMWRIAALLLGGLAVSVVPALTWAAQAQGPPGREQAAEPPPDARMLAELNLLRDLELLRQLDLLRKVDEPRRVPLPRATQEAKGKP